MKPNFNFCSIKNVISDNFFLKHSNTVTVKGTCTYKVVLIGHLSDLRQLHVVH